MRNFVELVVLVISLVRRDPTGTVASTSVYTATGIIGIPINTECVAVETGCADTATSVQAPIATATSAAIPTSSVVSVTDPTTPIPTPVPTPIPTAIATAIATGTASAITLVPSIVPASTLQTVILSSAVSGGSIVSATFAVPVPTTASSNRVSSLTSASAGMSMTMVPFTSFYTITYNGSYVSYSPEQATSSILKVIPSSIKSIASTNDVIATLALEQQFAYSDPPWFTTLPYDITQYYHKSSSLMTLFSYVATAHNAVAPSPTNQGGGGGGGLSKAASIGIGVGAGVGGLVLLIGLIVSLLYRRRQKRRGLAASSSAAQEGADMQEKRGTEYKSELPGGPVSRAELPGKDEDPYNNRANIRVYGQGRAEMSAVNY